MEIKEQELPTMRQKPDSTYIQGFEDARTIYKRYVEQAIEDFQKSILYANRMADYEYGVGLLVRNLRAYFPEIKDLGKTD